MSDMSADVGPKIMFPSTVGETSIPFPIAVGVRNIVEEHNPETDLSKIMYSPARGCRENELSPASEAILSAYSPAQFIMYFVFTQSPEEDNIS